VVTVAAKWLLQKLKVPASQLNWDIITSCFYYRAAWDLKSVPVFDSPRLLNATEMGVLEDGSKEPKFKPEEIPAKIQEGLGEENMRKYAAFYTGGEAMKAFAVAIDGNFEDDVVLCDPFCGSGCLIAGIAKLLKEKIRYVYGFELFPFSAMGAYISTVGALDGDHNRVRVVVGNSFGTVYSRFFGGGLFGDILPKANAVVSNPPYLPWTALPETDRKVAERTLRSGGHDETEGNFTSYGAALGDILLEKGGFYGAVLPQSIFYNEKTKWALKMFFEKYDLKAILTRDVFVKPYSMKSRAMDVLFMGFKGGPSKEYYAGMVSDATLARIASQFNVMGEVDGFKPRKLGGGSPMGINNPGAYLMEPEASVLLDEMYKTTGKKLGLMDQVFYKNVLMHQGSLNVTPLDFFFVPNKKWTVFDAGSDPVVLENTETHLHVRIEKRKMEPVFLRPVFSKGTSNAVPSHLGLMLDERLTDDERHYVESWGIEKRSSWWTKYRDMVLKEDGSRVHLARVLNLAIKYYAGIAYYTKDKMPPVSSFVRFSSGSDEDDRISVSWFNSIFFVAMLMVFGRRMNQDSLYMTTGDYKGFPFPKLHEMSPEDKSVFAKHVDGMVDLKSFWESIPRAHDKDWAKWLGVSDEELDRLVVALKASRGRYKPAVL